MTAKFTYAALALRDALVPLIQVHGRNPLLAPWDRWCPVLKAAVDGHSLVLVGPACTYEGKRVEVFHTLEVHDEDRELLALTWWDDGTAELLTFERGEWESAVVAALSALTVH